MHAAALRCRIRPLQADDIPQILDIERQSFPSMWPQTVYQRELKNSMARYLVATEPLESNAEAEATETDGVRRLVRRFFGGLPVSARPQERILGIVGLWLVLGEAHIVTIAVRPERRRQGIGELLLVAAIEAAIDEHQDEVTLECRISNHEARAMYGKYGFIQVGVRAKYYSDTQEDAVLMTTPKLRSSAYQQLLIERVAEQRARWGEDYPLAGRLSGRAKG
jgi:ribosomal-protein-alanine N-acetyltransferase